MPSSRYSSIVSSHPTTYSDGQAKANASFVLLQQEKTLYLNALLERANSVTATIKTGLLEVLHEFIQEVGLGNLIEMKPQHGANMVTSLFL